MQERSPIGNCWGAAEISKPRAEHIFVYRGTEGAAYNHHPQITSMDGRLFATWSSGYRDEDQLGQRMVVAISDDQGRTWSPPTPLVDRQPGEHGHGVVTSEGIRGHDGLLVAYYGYYDMSRTGMVLYYAAGGNLALAKPHETCHVDVFTGILVSRDAGASWDGPVGRVPGLVPNLRPAATSTGRLILPGNFLFPYTDDARGITGWTRTGIPGVDADSVDDPEGHVKIMQRRRGKVHVCEGSFFETDDRVIHMMLRSSSADCLAVSESHDDGETWSEPVLTTYTDCHSRSHFGRLPDGRFFCVSCPAPRSARTPLVLATSTDGVTFGTHYVLGDQNSTLSRIPGVHKYGRYGYPSYHLLEDLLLVIYSINKEDVALCRVRLEAL